MENKIKDFFDDHGFFMVMAMLPLYSEVLNWSKIIYGIRKLAFETPLELPNSKGY